jgi:DNA-binding NarL/FixJ family response regulator
VIRVIVADDHPLMLESVVRRLAEDPQICVVATASDGLELVERYARYRPTVVLADVRMPRGTGIEALRAIRELDRDAKVILLTAHDDPASVREAVRAGATGYVVKTVSARELVAHVHAVAAGRSVPYGDAFARAPEDAPRVPNGAPEIRSRLTEREKEVLVLLSLGLTNREISARLYVSSETVKAHVRNVYAKLGVTHRAAAARIAVERGLA